MENTNPKDEQSRWARLLFARYTLFNAWLGAVTLWLIVPVFLAAILAIYVPQMSTSPITSSVSIFFAIAVAVVVLWVTRLMVRRAGRDVQAAKRRPKAHAR